MLLVYFCFTLLLSRLGFRSSFTTSNHRPRLRKSPYLLALNLFSLISSSTLNSSILTSLLCLPCPAQRCIHLLLPSQQEIEATAVPVFTPRKTRNQRLKEKEQKATKGKGKGKTKKATPKKSKAQPKKSAKAKGKGKAAAVPSSTSTTRGARRVYVCVFACPFFCLFFGLPLYLISVCCVTLRM